MKLETAPVPVTTTVAPTMSSAVLQAGSQLAFGADLSVTIVARSDGTADVMVVHNGVVVGRPFGDLPVAPRSLLRVLGLLTVRMVPVLLRLAVISLALTRAPI